MYFFFLGKKKTHPVHIPTLIPTDRADRRKYTQLLNTYHVVTYFAYNNKSRGVRKVLVTIIYTDATTIYLVRSTYDRPSQRNGRQD